MRHAKRDYLLGGVPLWQPTIGKSCGWQSWGTANGALLPARAVPEARYSEFWNGRNQIHTLWKSCWPCRTRGYNKLLFPASSIPSTRKPPDYERVHRELAKNGVTLSLLWNEYCEECYASKELPLMYTQFCLHYREYAQQTKATMHLDHKPGEQMEVDWAGDTAKVTDPETGSQTPAYLFIAVLSCSGYA